VSGYVVRLAINDNVRVHTGDLLLVIDKRDYQAGGGWQGAAAGDAVRGDTSSGGVGN
jgi:hypothetical protein